MENIRYLFGSTRVNDEEREYLTQKVLKCRKLLSNYSPEELTTEVEVGQDKKGFWRIEVMIRTPHELFRVSKEDSDMFKAMDKLEDVLTEQIRRSKEKIRDRQRRKEKLAKVRV